MTNKNMKFRSEQALQTINIDVSTWNTFGQNELQVTEALDKRIEPSEKMKRKKRTESIFVVSSAQSWMCRAVESCYN